MHIAEPKAGESSKTVFYGLQVLRGMGALLVVFYHAAMRVTSDSPNAFPQGQFGVDIFFVISGIVIYISGRKLTGPDFLTRRLIRVVPLYWIILCVNLAGDMARQIHNPFQLTNYLLSFLFIPSHDQGSTVFPPIIVGWTLNYEMFFYMICTVAISLFGGARMLRTATIAIAAAVLLGLAIADVLPWRQYPITVLLLPITLEFVAGMWLGYFADKGRTAPPWAAVLLVLGGILWVALSPTAKAYTSWRLLTWGTAAIAIVWAVVSAERLIPFHRMKFALLLGNASYALYLIHQVAMGVLWAIFGKFHLQHHTWLAFFMLVMTAIGAGIITHLIAERPLLQLIGRHTSMRKPRSASTAPQA